MELLADKGTGYPPPGAPQLQEPQAQKAWGVFWGRTAALLALFYIPKPGTVE